ncbi:MAG TPA: 3,4-dihydroxy-2-butanone-4-phosphate synthase [Polyangiaceae bacterium]|nr:3,4-dihydroxy-2-butanone-4-phosphate synthase [Polyangiaceae bacterium]
MKFQAVEAAIAAVSRGEIVVVADDPRRENEGDLILAASAATPEKVAFMVRHTSGLLCVSARRQRLDALELPLMVPQNTESHQTAFTISVDYRVGTSTGISAEDRSATIRALADAEMGPGEFARPGHVFPLRARDGGVLVRPGHTEAASDLAELAGLPPLGALAEIVNLDGSMARGVQLERFAQEYGLAFITIAELVEYRRATERVVALRPAHPALDDQPASVTGQELSLFGAARATPRRQAVLSAGQCPAR